MSVRVFSDIHAHPFAYRSGRDGQDRLRHACAALQDALRDPGDAVLVGGDVWHQRGILPTQAVSGVLDAFKRCSVPIIAVAGNHDDVGAPGGPSAVEVLQKALPNCGVLRSWKHAPILGNVSVIGCGYKATIGEPERRTLAQTAASVAAGLPLVVLVHNGIAADRASADFPGEPFYSPEFFAPLAERGVDFLVLAGHWHRPKVVSAGTSTYPEDGYTAELPSGSMIQIGALLQHNWGDAGHARGWWDVVPPTVTGGEPWRVRFTDSRAPRFVVARDAAAARGARACDFVRVPHAAADPAVLGALASAGVETPEVEAPERGPEVARADLRLGDSDEALVAKYVAQHCEAGPDSDRLAALGRALLQEVSSCV